MEHGAEGRRPKRGLVQAGEGELRKDWEGWEDQRELLSAAAKGGEGRSWTAREEGQR